MASMSHLAQNEIQSDQRSGRPESTASHRRRPLRVLFVHRDADAIESCLQELKKAQFTVSADFVLTLAQCTEQLRFQSYDVVVAEYPNPNWKGSQALQLLHQAVQEIPLLFVTTAMGSESIDRKSTRLNSSHVSISYAVFCLKKKNKIDRLVEGQQPSAVDVKHLNGVFPHGKRDRHEFGFAKQSHVGLSNTLCLDGEHARNVV